jgi:BirA family biotin operon repressor/biotin-[acetyl-CoA-carboxylase] ligase
MKLNTLNKNKILENINESRVNVAVYNTIGSTNDECKSLKHTNEFNIVLAEEQTKGRGRMGKEWLSPLGNIYMSIAFDGSKSNEPLSLISGLICQEAINKVIGDSSIGLKWPNDIILNKKKVGGILIEKEVLGSNVTSIVGIGLNLKLVKKESWWGDLSEYQHIDKNELINIILRKFISYCDQGIDKWKEKWEKSCIHLNSNIKIQSNNINLNEGICIGITNRGALRINSNKDGKIYEYEYGDISVKGVY